MKLKQHILYGGVASLCLVPKFGLLSSVFWAASVLIDIDHYIDFVYRNQCTSLGINITRGLSLNRDGKTKDITPGFGSGMRSVNLLGEQAVFLLRKT